MNKNTSRIKGSGFKVALFGSPVSIYKSSGFNPILDKPVRYQIIGDDTVYVTSKGKRRLPKGAVKL